MPAHIIDLLRSFATYPNKPERRALLNFGVTESIGRIPCMSRYSYSNLMELLGRPDHWLTKFTETFLDFVPCHAWGLRGRWGQFLTFHSSLLSLIPPAGATSLCGLNGYCRRAGQTSNHGKRCRTRVVVASPSALLPPRVMGSLCGSKPLPEEVQRRSSQDCRNSHHPFQRPFIKSASDDHD